MATTRSTSAPAVSPVVSTPSSPNPPSRRLWTSAITIDSGMSTRPIPRNSGARVTYMRAAAERIWPHVRRRAIRSGTAGRHFVRVIAKTASARSTPRKRTVAPGLRSSEMSAFEPVSTAEQKKSVAPVPKIPLVGTA